jgi:hypothetical protein
MPGLIPDIPRVGRISYPPRPKPNHPKVFWFFFSKKNREESASFLKKRSKKLFSIWLGPGAPRVLGA